MSAKKLEPRFILARQKQEPETIEIGNARMNVVVHPIGQQAPVHGHQETHVIFVRSGKMTFEMAGQTQEVGQGDMVIAPPEIVHTFKVVGQEPCQTVCVCIPQTTF